MQTRNVWGIVIVSVVAILALTGAAVPAPASFASSTSAPARRPAPSRTTSGARPANVPADFVPTPNGYFHPSCIVALAADELLGHDRVVRAKDGASRRALTPCDHPHFSPSGILLGPQRGGEREGAGRSKANAARPASDDGGSEAGGGSDGGDADADASGDDAGDAATIDGGDDAIYDGWLIAFRHLYYPKTPVTPTLIGKWIVPPKPTVGGPDDAPTVLYLFNGIEGNGILQPVLGYYQAPTFGFPAESWTIASWSCCVEGFTAVSAEIQVNPGDLLEGTTAGTDCDPKSAICSSWTITTADLTTGQSTVLSSADPMAPESIEGAVLEAYDVKTCDMFPPGGEETFFDTTLTAGDGGPLTLVYTPYVLGNAGSPDCGYRGFYAGDSYTLVYANTPQTAQTALTLSATPVPAGSFAGANVTLIANLTTTGTAPALQGETTFTDGTTVLGSADVVAATDGSGHAIASATLSVPSVPGGTHTFVATYGGFDAYQPSTATATLTLNPWATATTLAATPVAVVETNATHLVATITSTVPVATPPIGGMVTFFSGSTTLGAAAVKTSPNGGGGVTATATATLDATNLVVGTDLLGASYLGDPSHSASSSSLTNVTVSASLAVSPPATVIPPRGSLNFSSAAGASPVAWAIATNASGATLDPVSAFYVAGPTPNVTDIVRAVDNDGAAATATVTVGPGASISPSSARVPSGATSPFTASGGSGEGFTWSLTASPSGGSIDPVSGIYTAGVNAGVTDEIAVADSLGNTATASVTVVAGDGGTEGDGGVTTTSSSQGCNCTTAAGGARDRGSPGTFAGLALALAALFRPARRARRARHGLQAAARGVSTD